METSEAEPQNRRVGKSRKNLPKRMMRSSKRTRRYRKSPPTSVDLEEKSEEIQVPEVTEESSKETTY